MISSAAIVAVGSELLGTDRVDTNSLFLTNVLERHGVTLVGKAVVGDDEDAIATEVGRRLGQVDVVLMTGGLGPTADDVTRQAVAAVTGRRLVHDDAIEAELRERFATYLRRMPEVNLRQAEVIDGAEVLANRRGTAPGMRLEHDGTTIYLFPGVPSELRAIAEDALEPWLAERADAALAVERRTFKVAARAESAIEERIAPIYKEFGRHDVSVLASPGRILIHVTARGKASERTARLDAISKAIRQALGHRIFTEDPDASIESVVGAQLAEAGLTIAIGESCTGGLVTEMLTRVPGSSAYLIGGVVAYSNTVKTALLSVDDELVATHGAVSEPVARAMARGVRRRLGADLGIGITGIAGPGGGSEDKPVGTVHLAVADADGELHRTARFPGDRERIRLISARTVLEMTRQRLLDGARD
ncbi:MAG: competence/damage-inducible protein A [Acidobacteriota bacterium]